MKNPIVILIALCLTFVSTQSFAQNVTSEEVEFKKGDIELSAGVGLLSTFNSKSTTTKVLPVNFMLNYRINQNVSIGGYLAYSSTEWKPQPTADEVPKEYLINNFYVAGLRAEGHFNKDRIDFYGGAMLGVTKSNIDTNILPTDPQPENVQIDFDPKSKFTYSGYLGLKYMMTKHFGVYGEIGYGASLVSVGITSKF